MNVKLILCVGVGSLGSHLARELVGSPIFCKARYCFADPDIVEEKNLRNQIYTRLFLGQSKVDALVESLTPENGGTNGLNRTSQSRIEDLASKDLFFFMNWDIIVVAVDNMETRKFVFGRFRLQAKPDSLLVDLRGSGRQLSLYFIRNQDEDAQFYEKTLYKDEDVQLPGCDAEITQRNALICSALSMDALYNIVNGMPYSKEIVFDTKRMSMVVGGEK